MSTNCLDLENHYSVKQVAEKLGVSEKVVRSTFANYPGVFRFGHSGSIDKRKYNSIRIPLSAIEQYKQENSVCKF